MIVRAAENDGRLLKLDRSTDVKGPDTNTNGVRDDIDALIASQSGSATQKSAMTQLAKTFQVAVVGNPADAAARNTANLASTRAVHCIFTRFPGSDGARQAHALVSTLEAATANTPARLRAYLAYNQALSGTVSSVPQGDTCD